MIEYYKINFPDGRKIYIQFNQDTKIGVEVTPKSLMINKGEYMLRENSTDIEFYKVLNQFHNNLSSNLIK